MRMVGTECIRNILFILPLGAEWMEWRSVHSGIWMWNRRTRAFHILAILILELWIEKRALVVKPKRMQNTYISNRNTSELTQKHTIYTYLIDSFYVSRLNEDDNYIKCTLFFFITENKLAKDIEARILS